MVKRIVIEHPDIVLYEKDKKYNVEDDVKKPFRNVVNTGSLEIRKGTFRMLDSKHNPILKTDNISLEVNNIKLDSAIVKQDIPFQYKDYNLRCGRVFYRASRFYSITADSLQATDSSVAVTDFKLVPQYGRKQFTKMLSEEKDLFNVEAKSITLPYVNWGFVNDTLFVHAPKAVLDKVAANIYRNKEPKDDPTRKKLYSEALRNLDFDLKIERLVMRNSYIEYEEQLNFSRPAASVSFSRFNADIKHIYSAVNKKQIPATVIRVNALFMKKSPMSVTWSFNVPDASDAFTIKGRLQGLQGKSLNELSMPLMNIATDSDIKDVRFTINGNRNNATGSFAINYDNMKVAVYKKDGKEKNRFMSAIGNLIVKNDSNEKLKRTDIKVDRLKDKSVFNFLWRCLQEGLKQTLLPKAVTAVLPEGGKKQKKKD
ncbi:hypothetical protein CHU92_08240 [Flavobacterium cyanobacteriorum]|uniref:DUF748 domain-containing protein n=1 Tax=Flavobacterium cyanobacteriorum TaxID=2022802 RepID=A0A255Z7D1_9FLAO|nr:hypothetical protein [Flavobacterium cyanobacteriorum]OYQ37457.1 hypothetical protein CHU92_08240 [Flavobacterium cyanobacteriorum]